jgi:hypothetical protein
VDGLIWGFLPNAPKRYSWASRRQSNIAIDGHSGQPLNDYVHVQKDYLLQELVAPVKIDVLPGDGRYIFGCGSALRISGLFLVFQESGED